MQAQKLIDASPMQMQPAVLPRPFIAGRLNRSMQAKTLKLRDYADAIVHNSGHESIVLNLDANAARKPHEIMAHVTLLVAQQLWGDLPTWNLDHITPEAWQALKHKMACTEWAPCIATKRVIPGVTHRPSQSKEGYWLWQDTDFPAGVQLKMVSHLDLWLWCVPEKPNTDHFQ